MEHRAFTSTSSAAGTRQPPGFLREELHIDGKLVTLLYPPLLHTCPTRPPHLLARAVFYTTAQPLQGTWPADGGEHWDIAAPGGGNAPAVLNPSTAHPAAQRLSARSWLSEGARYRWKPGPGSSSKGKTRTRVVSAQELLLCGAVERSFPEQGNAATQPKSGMRGRSGESRRKLTEPSNAHSPCSLFPWLLQPSPCQHLYPGPAATAADSCCHPGPNLLSSVQQRLGEGRAQP